MSRSDAQRIDDLEHHLMVAESMGREFESAIVRKDAALEMAVANLEVIVRNNGEKYLDAASAEHYATQALAACREAMKETK